MDINSDQANDVMRIFFLTGGMTGLFVERTVHIAMTKLNGEPTHNTDMLMRFIGNDITIFVLTLACSLTVIVSMLRTADLPYIIDLMSAIRGSNGLFGWLLYFAWWLFVFAPLLVGIMLYVGRRKRKAKYGDRWELMKMHGFHMS